MHALPHTKNNSTLAPTAKTLPAMKVLLRRGDRNSFVIDVLDHKGYVFAKVDARVAQTLAPLVDSNEVNASQAALLSFSTHTILRIQRLCDPRPLLAHLPPSHTQLDMSTEPQRKSEAMS